MLMFVVMIAALVVMVVLMGMGVFVRVIVIVVVSAAIAVFVDVSLLTMLVWVGMRVLVFPLCVFVRMRMSVGMGMRVFRFVVLVLLRPMDSSFVDCETHAFDLLPLRPVEMHMKLADWKLGQFPLESGRTDAEIDQRAYGHVATDAGDAVEIEGFHGQRREIARCGASPSKASANIRETDFAVVECLANDAAVESRHSVSYTHLTLPTKRIV